MGRISQHLPKAGQECNDRIRSFLPIQPGNPKGNLKIKSRIVEIDFAKSIAIFLVMLTHAIEKSKVAHDTEFLRPFLYSIDRVGVPIFLMCAGALAYTSNDGINFSKLFRRFLQIAVILVTFSIITNAVYLLIEGKNFLDAAILSVKWSNVILFGSAGYALHLWYLIVFLPLFLLTPYLKKMVSKCTLKEALVFLGLCFVFGPISGFISSTLGKNLLSEMSAQFSGAYVFYIVAGELIFNRGLLKRDSSRARGLGAALFLLGVAASVLLQVTWPKAVIPLLWYSTSPTIAISSIGAFLFIVSNFQGAAPKIVKTISENSFGAYLIHFALILITLHLIKTYAPDMSLIGKFFILFAAALLSIPITWVLRKNRAAAYFVS